MAHCQAGSTTPHIEAGRSASAKSIDDAQAYQDDLQLIPCLKVRKAFCCGCGLLLLLFKHLQGPSACVSQQLRAVMCQNAREHPCLCLEC